MSVQTTLVLGGARSGKSNFAENLAIQTGLARYYLATAQAYDKEMEARISKHQNDRQGKWITIEEPINLLTSLKQYSSSEKIILVDCLTLWLSNLIGEGRSIDEEIDQLVQGIKSVEGSVIFVSNEVGQGIVPDNALAREFRDYVGRLHQELAACVDTVYFITAGLAQKLK
jgi:adenosylcobinamide kinase / adenosylcobinamide-phosphate guanylyltransferase